ncbi:sensor histidine kinase [Svornostia abyssi]|uniref:histidine kinase n=1 Tax=Svornostia abyssi TaxID=2898438 RepID=A0ABY5PBN3_9ACTN|nr:sensor histidine kinase [Parviterribacteraceae bacterium J379]
MSSLRPALIGIGLLGLLLTAMAVAVQLTTDRGSITSRTVDAIVVSTVMAIYIGTGLFAWARRPHNLVGALLCATGFTFMLNSLTVSDTGWVFTLGSVLGSVFFIVFAQLVLTYPTGRAATAAERRLLAAGYGLAIGVPLAYALFSPDLEGHSAEEAPANLILLADLPWLADAIDVAGSLAGVAVIAGLLWLMVQRWREATSAARRLLTPILVCGGALIVLLGSVLIADLVVDDDSVLYAVLNLAALVPFLALPFVFLTGLLRSRWVQVAAVGDLLERLGGEERQQLGAVVAEALEDPSVTVAYWLDAEERFVDDDGRPVTLPDPDDPARAAVEVRHGDVLVGVIVHDRSLEEERDIVGAAANAAALAMENGRLEAELRARVEDLRESRARLVTEGMAERRRLERDLHDGAQQRLVSLSLQLGLARGAVDRDPGEARLLLDRAAGELDQALAELRELARGLHPAILTDRGLPAAIEVLAARSPTPVEVEEVAAERLPAPVEAAAYFVVSEALANLAKHAEAEHATVRVQRENGHAVVEVHDDGRGGADADGHGLRGLSDRVAALDGRLDVESPPGKGTTIRAEIPCASS